MRLNIAVDLPDDADPDLVDGYCVAVTAIARQLFPPVWTEIKRGESDESIRRNGRPDNSINSNSGFGVGISDTHRHSDLRQERGVESVRSTAVDRAGVRSPETGPGVAGQPERAESGSDRLSGPPEGPVYVPKERRMALHRGRRRRLLAALKRVGAGRRFKR